MNALLPLFKHKTDHLKKATIYQQDKNKKLSKQNYHTSLV